MSEHIVIPTRLTQILMVGFITGLLVACNTDQSTETDTATLVLHRKQDSQALSDGIPSGVTRLSIEVRQIIENDDPAKDIFIIKGDMIITKGDVMSTDTLKLPVPAGLPLRIISEAYASSETYPIEEFLYGGAKTIEPLARVESRQLQLQLGEKVTINLDTNPSILSNDPDGYPIVAKITGLKNTQLNWSVNNIKGGNETVGTITDEGLYRAPSNQPEDMTVTISITPEVAPSYERTYGFDVDRRPAANAGPLQSVEVGALVTLDGRDSTDFDDDTFDYIWTPPENIELSATDIAQPTFTIPEGTPAGTKYTFVLEVKDDDNRGSSDSVIVDITVNNSPPTVIIIPPEDKAKVGEEFTLPNDSTDPNNDTLRYQWTAPEGITLSDPTEPKPSFTVPANSPDTLLFELVVDDRNGGLSEATVEIEVEVEVVVNPEGLPPTARAGPPQSVEVGTLVTLDGSESIGLNYLWTPPADIELSATDIAQPTFTLPEGAASGKIYSFSLTVTNDKGDTSVPDTVDITVDNSPPTAIIIPPEKPAKVGEEFTLPNDSTDPNNDTLSYQWTAPEGITLSDPTSKNPSFTVPDSPGTLLFKLVVDDGNGESSEATVEVEVTVSNSPPIANAGPPQSVEVGALVTLDGSASADPDGDTLSHEWTTPEGITLSNPTEPKPTFTVPPGILGALPFKLVVNDGNGGSSEATVDVTVLNSPPTANAGQDQDAVAGTQVTLDGSGSTDPNDDDNELTYQWTTPEGITLSNPTEPKPTFTAPTLLGPLEITLVVTDNNGSTSKSDPNTDPSTDYKVIINVNNLLSFEEALLKIDNDNLRQCIKDTGKKLVSELTQLNCSDMSITELDGLEYFTPLTDLSLPENQIDKIEPLSSLTNLTILKLPENNVTNLDPLSNLTGLTELQLLDNKIGDITPLSELTALRILKLGGNEIEDISILKNLTGLTQLGLRSNRVDNLEPLNLEPLSQLTALTQLGLRSNRIDNIEPLSDLTALTQLYLSTNLINDIEPLRKLTALSILDLSETQITDVYDVLSNLINLSNLNLNDNLNLFCGDVEDLDMQFDSSDDKDDGIVRWSTCVNP